MSDVPTVRLPFGTLAAVYPSAGAAGAAVAALTTQGYPRELVSVLRGQAWSEPAPAAAGYRPDPELAARLVPVAPEDGARAALPAGVAAFAGTLPVGPARRRSAAFWPLIVVAAVAAIVVVAMLSSGGWFSGTLWLVVGLQVVVGTSAFAFTRSRPATFPFRDRIGAVDAALASGGALVVVRCTVPYRAALQSRLVTAGGEVLGFAADTIYPVPA